MKHFTYFADEAYQVAPGSRIQYEYDRLMCMDKDKREEAYNDLKFRMECGTYWADEALQLTGQEDYDRLMGMDLNERENAFKFL